MMLVLVVLYVGGEVVDRVVCGAGVGWFLVILKPFLMLSSS